jgi:hypothetical protein
MRAAGLPNELAEKLVAAAQAELAPSHVYCRRRAGDDASPPARAGCVRDGPPACSQPGRKSLQIRRCHFDSELTAGSSSRGKSTTGNLWPQAGFLRPEHRCWTRSRRRVICFAGIYGACGTRTRHSGLQTQLIARPHLTLTDRIGMTEPKSAVVPGLARHRSTAVRSHRARTGAASMGNIRGPISQMTPEDVRLVVAGADEFSVA